jgi:TetR/AcrR family transcriptional regulator
MNRVKEAQAPDHNTAAVILESAEELFGRFGFGKVTMEEIAGRAGLGKATLYYYYSTKEELFQAVVYAQYRQFEERMTATLESNRPVEERILGYVDERFEFFAWLLKLQITDFNSIPKNRPLNRQMFGKFSAQELGWLVKLFRDGKEAGRFGIDSEEAIAEAFLHVMSGLRARFLRTVELPLEQSQKKALRKELLFVAEIFLRGISAKAASPSEHRVRKSTRNK